MKFDLHIVEEVRKQAKINAQTGELSKEILAYIYKHRLFKLFVPKNLGGTMTPLPEALKIFADASSIDGSFGWLVTIGSGGGYFAPSLTQETAEEIFAPEDAVIAGSGQPTGTAVKTDGGYYVTGNWRYCSGALHATTFTANCIVKGEYGDKDGKIISVALKPEQVRIIKDWNALGLQGTASHTIETENAFVPLQRTFSIFEQISYRDEPLYSFPFMAFSQASFAAIIIGICRRFFDEADELVSRFSASWDTVEGRSALVKEQLEAAENLFRDKEEEFFALIEEKWTKHVSGEKLSEEEEKALSAICIDTAAIARKAVNDVYPFLGMEVVKEGNVILSVWKDIQTAGQHLLLSPLFK